MNLINYGGELGVLGVERVDRVHGRVEVLDVLGVHLEEGSVLHHDVSYPLILRAFFPFIYPIFELKVLEL